MRNPLISIAFCLMIPSLGVDPSLAGVFPEQASARALFASHIVPTARAFTEQALGAQVLSAIHDAMNRRLFGRQELAPLRRFVTRDDGGSPSDPAITPPSSDPSVSIDPEDLVQTFLPQLKGRIEAATGVLFPTEMTSQMFLNFIVQEPQRFRGRRVLVPGTGSGADAIALAQVGARQVVATDVLPHAVALARHNRSRQPGAVQRAVLIGQSDLYEGLAQITGEARPQFDVVIFNHPIEGARQSTYYPKTFASNAGRNFEVIKRAIDGLDQVLSPEGEAYFWVMDDPAGRGDLWGTPELTDYLAAKPGWHFEKVRDPIRVTGTLQTLQLVRTSRVRGAATPAVPQIHRHDPALEAA